MLRPQAEGALEVAAAAGAASALILSVTSGRVRRLSGKHNRSLQDPVTHLASENVFPRSGAGRDLEARAPGDLMLEVLEELIVQSLIHLGLGISVCLPRPREIEPSPVEEVEGRGNPPVGMLIGLDRRVDVQSGLELAP